MAKKQYSMEKLTDIPGISTSIAQDFHDLGIQTPYQLIGKNPQKLYEQLCQLHGQTIDPCVLYTFRCAVYFSSTNNHRPELLKWWNWKNRTINEEN